MNRLLRFARSPRVAIALILGVSIYVGAVTMVPQQPLVPQEHAEWIASGSPFVTLLSGLGLDNAHTNPFFLLLAAALAFSTGVCSWDRTRSALRLWRGRGTVTPALTERLLKIRPLAVVEGGLDAADAVANDASGTLGMRRRSGRTLSYAERGAAGLFGSPLFHWSLVALIIVVSLGQLTRWEGLVGVAEGKPTAEVLESYRKIDKGPFPAPHTGWQLLVTDLDEDKKIDDVYYGVVPTVALMDGGVRRAEAQVYPNNPLREGPLLIHLSDYGLSVGIEVLDESGVSQGSTDKIIDFDEATESGTIASGFDVNTDTSRIASVSVEVAARDRNGNLPRLRPPNPVAIVTADLADGTHVAQRLGSGQEMALAEGWSLKVTAISYYARLSVVRDWSLPWIYLLLGTATIGLVLAIMVPYRALWLRMDESERGVEMRVVAMQHGRDPYFRQSIVAALREAGACVDEPARAGSGVDEGERA